MPQQFPRPPKRERRAILATAVTLVLAAGIAGSVWLWRSGGDSAAVDQDDLPHNPDLEELPFPDPDSLGFGGGPARMCGAAEKALSPRGYLRATEGRTGGGIYCRFVTPGLSLLKDGSYDLLVDVAIWRGNAEERYQRVLDLAARKQDRNQTDSQYRVNKIEQFPVGDAGFVFHRETATQGDTEAYFRSGEDLMQVSVWGAVQHVADGGQDAPSEPLTQRITYREITDVVTALNGKGTPGKPQITEPDLAGHPALAGAEKTALPAGTTAGEACDKVVPVARKLGVEREDTRGCAFAPAGDDRRNHQESYVEREITIGVGEYEPDANTPASEKMAQELRTLLSRTSGDEYRRSPVYELPVGDVGYALYHTYDSRTGYLQAAYVVDAITYVHIDIRGFRDTGNELTALTEDTLITDLTTVLTALGR